MSVPFRVLRPVLSSLPKATRPHAKGQETLTSWLLFFLWALFFSPLLSIPCTLGGYVVQYFPKWAIVGYEINLGSLDEFRRIYRHHWKYQSISYAVGATVLWNFSLSYINMCVCRVSVQQYFPYSGSWLKRMRATDPFHWLLIYRIIEITEIFLNNPISRPISTH